MLGVTYQQVQHIEEMAMAKMVEKLREIQRDIYCDRDEVRGDLCGVDVVCDDW
jgi:hypothetical protein